MSNRNQIDLQLRALELNQEIDFCSNECRILGQDLDEMHCPDWCSGSGQCGFCCVESEYNLASEAMWRATNELNTIRRYQRKLEKLSSRGI